MHVYKKFYCRNFCWIQPKVFLMLPLLSGLFSCGNWSISVTSLGCDGHSSRPQAHGTGTFFLVCPYRALSGLFSCGNWCVSMTSVGCDGHSSRSSWVFSQALAHGTGTFFLMCPYCDLSGPSRVASGLLILLLCAPSWAPFMGHVTC